MSTKKKVLLKVIILGDTGYVDGTQHRAVSGAFSARAGRNGFRRVV